MTKDVYERVMELNERPTAVAALNTMLNHSEFFLAFMRNFTGEDLPFTQVEFDVLDKMINETRVSTVCAAVDLNYLSENVVACLTIN